MSSQKFIARNRAPRVQIEYDVEAYGAERRVQLPFVVGVLADLKGNAGKGDAPVKERKLTDITADDFDRRMEGVRPALSIQVPNTLTGEGQLEANLTFKSMDDFSPAAIARNVPALSRLLEARERLSNLITYMDGKEGAERFVQNLLKNPSALEAVLQASGEERPNDAPSDEKEEKP